MTHGKLQEKIFYMNILTFALHPFTSLAFLLLFLNFNDKSHNEDKKISTQGYAKYRHKVHAFTLQEVPVFT